MSVKLRLRRLGRKKLPVYSLVAADTRSPRDGRYIEDLGRYEPLNDPASVRLNEDRILHWLREGAQPSDTVRNLLSGQGVMLRLHMLRKGKTEEEIDQAVTEFLAHRAENQPVKKSKTELRQERMDAERAVAAEKAKEIEMARAEREAELEKQRQDAEDAERTKRAAADAEVIAESGDEAAVETEAAPEAAAEEAAAEAAPEAVAEEHVPSVDAAAREAIAGAEPVDPEPISKAEAAAAEMVGEGAPVETGEVVAPVDAETPAEEPVADEAPAEISADEEPVEIPRATPEEAAEDPSTEPMPEKARTRKPVATEASAEPDNLTKIRGIGPKFSALLNQHGITTFAQLAALKLEPLRTIVNESGISSASANEESWARQAAFLAADDKDGLKAFVDELRKA